MSLFNNDCFVRPRLLQVIIAWHSAYRVAWALFHCLTDKHCLILSFTAVESSHTYKLYSICGRPCFTVVTTRMTPALNWAAVWAILMFIHCGGKESGRQKLNKVG